MRSKSVDPGHSVYFSFFRESTTPKLYKDLCHEILNIIRVLNTAHMLLVVGRGSLQVFYASHLVIDGFAPNVCGAHG